MSTPRDLMKDVWERCKILLFFKAELEDYVLFTAVKILFFGIGIAVGYHWL